MPLSPEENARLEYLKAKYAELSQGMDDSNPTPTDVHGDSDRVKEGFSDDAGLHQLLGAKGYRGIHRNAHGELVMQDPQGTWIKDANNFFRGRPLDDGDFGKDFLPESVQKYLPEHPINSMEKNLGHALPLAGMIGGAIAGAPGVVTGVGGAMAGGMAGEKARRDIGRYAGVYKGDPNSAEEIKSLMGVGLDSGTAEMGGKIVGQLPVPDAVASLKARAFKSNGNVDQHISAFTEDALAKLRGLIARTSSVMSGVPKEAVEKLIQLPRQVRDANTPDNIYKTAEKAQQELISRDESMLRNQQLARETSIEKNRGTQMDTNPMVDYNNEFIERKSPNANGVGPLSQNELSKLSNLNKKLYTSKEYSGTEPLPDALESRLMFDRENPITLREYADPVRVTPVEGRFVKNGPREKLADPIRMTPTEPRFTRDGNPITMQPEIRVQPMDAKISMGPADVQNLPTGTHLNPYDPPPTVTLQELKRKFVKSGNQEVIAPAIQNQPMKSDIVKAGPVETLHPATRFQPMKTEVVKSGNIKELAPARDEISVVPFDGVENDVPRMPYEDLYKSADYLDSRVKNHFDDLKASNRTSSYINHLKGMRHKIKEAMHKVDPDLQAADSAFNKHKNDTALMGRLEDPATMESYISNFFGKNKTLQEAAASRAIPDTYANELANIGANRAFAEQPVVNAGKLNPRKALQYGAGATAGAGAFQGNANLMMLGAGITGATSPTVHKAVISRLSLLSKPIRDQLLKDPQLLPSLMYQQSPWSLLKNEKEQ